MTILAVMLSYSVIRISHMICLHSERAFPPVSGLGIDIVDLIDNMHFT